MPPKNDNSQHLQGAVTPHYSTCPSLLRSKGWQSCFVVVEYRWWLCCIARQCQSLNNRVPARASCPERISRVYFICVLKLFREHICSFSNNFYILHYCIVGSYVVDKVIERVSLDELFNIAGIFQNVLQTPFVLSFFSHISGFCRCLHFQQHTV